MTDLTCSAEHCAYNSDRYCCKGDIQVDGANACHCSDTCCASFKESGCGCASNHVGTPSRSIGVSCDAVSCVYNENHECSAKDIAIAGHQAKHASQTECTSYQKR